MRILLETGGCIVRGFGAPLVGMQIREVIFDREDFAHIGGLSELGMISAMDYMRDLGNRFRPEPEQLKKRRLGE